MTVKRLILTLRDISLRMMAGLPVTIEREVIREAEDHLVAMAEEIETLEDDDDDDEQDTKIEALEAENEILSDKIKLLEARLAVRVAQSVPES